MSADLQKTFRELGGFSIKKYKEHREMHDDSISFNAEIHQNGKLVGTILNRGYGGPNDYSFTERQTAQEFTATAKTLYKDSTCEDSLAEELIERFDLVKTAAKEAKKGRPIVLRLKTGPEHISINYTTFDADKVYSLAEFSLATEKIKQLANKPKQYVIYNSNEQAFYTEFYIPAPALVKKLELREEKRRQEDLRKKETWSEPKPLENCPRFLLSENEDHDVIISDSETGRQAQTSLYNFNCFRSVLAALFGDEKQKEESNG